MVEVLNTEHTNVLLDSVKKLVIINRTIPTAVDEDLYKKEALLWAEIYPKYKPKLQLLDMTENHYVISSELQKWLNINVLAPALKSGLENVAFVVSPTLFAKLSHEVVMEEKTGKNFNIKYFENNDKALEWLSK